MVYRDGPSGSADRPRKLPNRFVRKYAAEPGLSRTATSIIPGGKTALLLRIVPGEALAEFKVVAPAGQTSLCCMDKYCLVRQPKESSHLEPVNILLADDHTLVRAGIRALVEQLPTVKVVGEAKDGREALRLVKERKPDLILMDVAMPGLNGLEATARLSKEFPDVRVIIISMYANEEYVREAIKAGAAGYLVKRSAATELERAITAVARGEKYFSPLVSAHVNRDRDGNVSADRASIDRLTPRQREILQLVAERHSTKDIAGILDISIKTVETHRSQLMERLDIHDVPGLVRFAIRAGLVSLDE